MANQVSVPRRKPPAREPEKVRPQLLNAGGAAPRFSIPEVHKSMLGSLVANLWDMLFPERLPPLQLTSRPVAVREIWSKTNKKQSAIGSLVLHGMGIGALIGLSIMALRTKPVEKPQQIVTFIAPVSDYQPVMQPKVAPKPLAGGGGGGERAKIFESKGHLPKIAEKQFTPPTVEIRDTKPKLAMEPTIVAPPTVKLPDNRQLPNLGN